MAVKKGFILGLLCFCLVALYSYEEVKKTADITSVQELMAVIPSLLGQTFQDTRIESLLVDGHTVILIGEGNHQNPKYRELSALLHQMAVNRKLAFFKEGIPRNPDVEKLWTQFRLGDRTLESGLLFGMEDDLAYLISDWATELGRFRMSGGRRSKHQNDNFLLKFLLSAKAGPIWDLFVANASTEPFNQMALVLDPQIRLFVDLAHSGESPPVSLTEDFSPAQWAMLYLALLQVASKEVDLSNNARGDLDALLKDPMNPNALVEFNDAFGRIYRSERMIANIRDTLPMLPRDVLVVILVGKGHVSDLLGGLSADTRLTSKRAKREITG